jgi:hypothetical protein
MSIEAYRVAVRISLVENVTRGLSMMARHFRTTDAEAKVLERRMQAISKLALGGGLLAGAGMFGLGLFKGPIDEASKYQRLMAQLKAQGVGDYQLAQADKFARAQNIMGASTADALRMVSETNSVLRDMNESIAVTPRLLKMRLGMNAVMGEGKGEISQTQFMAALKTAELRGALVDPVTQKFSAARFNQTLDFMTRAYTASGGLVKPTDYLAMIKTGGIAAKNLSDQSFYFGLMHMMQESGGTRVGTSLMSGFQNMYMGRTTQQVAEQMAKDGLLDRSKLHYGKTGHITKLDPGSIDQAELFRTNQFEYMNRVLIPRLKAQGIADGPTMEIALGKLFSNRTASNLWTTMYRERTNISKHIGAAGKAMGVDDLAKAAMETPQGKMLDLYAKELALKQQLGEVVMPIYVKILERTRDALKGISNFAKASPTAFKGLVLLFGAVSAAAVAGGSMMLLTAGFRGLALVVPALRIVGPMLSIFAGTLSYMPGLFRVLIAAMGPVGWTIAAIGAAGWLIWNNWKEIKSSLLASWSDIKQGFMRLFSGDILGALTSFTTVFLRGWQTIFNTLIAGINTVLPTGMKIGKFTFADTFADAHPDTVRPRSVVVHATIPVHVGNKHVVTHVARHFAEEMSRPSAGGTSFDPTRHRPSVAGGR